MSSHAHPSRVADAVKAFRRATEQDGSAASLTRSRVMVRTNARARRQRRMTASLIAAALLALAGSFAMARLLEHVRARAGAAHGDSPARSARAQHWPAQRSVHAPAPVEEEEIAPAPISDVPAPPPRATPPNELALYGAAHAAHFAAHDARRALHLWTRYLQRFPHGHFVPEATYNRALALLRLGRKRDAITALRPIAAGQFGAYRRPEAEALIDALTAASD